EPFLCCRSERTRWLRRLRVARRRSRASTPFNPPQFDSRPRGLRRIARSAAAVADCAGGSSIARTDFSARHTRAAGVHARPGPAPDGAGAEARVGINPTSKRTAPHHTDANLARRPRPDLAIAHQ